MAKEKSDRAHLIAGGFPPGSQAGHDHDYARLRDAAGFDPRYLYSAQVDWRAQYATVEP